MANRNLTQPSSGLIICTHDVRMFTCLKSVAALGGMQVVEGGVRRNRERNPSRPRHWLREQPHLEGVHCVGKKGQPRLATTTVHLKLVFVFFALLWLLSVHPSTELLNRCANLTRAPLPKLIAFLPSAGGLHLRYASASAATRAACGWVSMCSPCSSLLASPRPPPP